MKGNPQFLVTSPHTCSYIEENLAQTVFLAPECDPTPVDYSILVQHGFRRSGEHIYRPNCESCTACVSVRICVNDFELTRRFRRILKKNSDLQTRHFPTGDIADFYSLFEQYIASRHRDGDMYPTSPAQYASFLEANLGNCEYLAFMRMEQTFAVAVTDILSDGLASVYSFFDGEQSARSLGTFAILQQIAYCKRLNLPYLYLGYWIKNSRKMSYKTDFQPLEYFVDECWTRDKPTNI